MKTYKVEITEILQKVVEVEAMTEEETFDIVEDRYENEMIVLYSCDIVDSNIEVIGEC